MFLIPKFLSNFNILIITIITITQSHYFITNCTAGNNCLTAKKLKVLLPKAGGVAALEDK